MLLNTIKQGGSNAMRNPLILLLAAGTLLGFNFPLAKVAGNAGVPPIVWAMLVSLGSAAFLLPTLVAKQSLSWPKGATLRYAIISGPLTFAAPNLLVFTIVPHTGAGYTGLMFALSPVFTLALASLFKFKTTNLLGLLGIALGLIGAVLVSLARGASESSPPVIWLASSLLIPLILALGNVYRSLDWPSGAAPDVLAFWSHACATLIYLLLIATTQENTTWALLTLAPTAALTQLLVSGIAAPLLFRLQQHGGPVLFSQIGYVAAAVSLATATLMLNEQYSGLTWLGAGIIALGIFGTILAGSLAGNLTGSAQKSVSHTVSTQ